MLLSKVEMDKLSKRETKEKIEWCEFENFKKGVEHYEGTVRTQEKIGLSWLVFFFLIIIFAGTYIDLPFILSVVVATGVVIFLWKKDKESSGHSTAEQKLEGQRCGLRSAQETLQYLRSRYRSLEDDDDD